MTDEHPPLLTRDDDCTALLIDEANETPPLLHDSTLIDTSDNHSKSSPDQNSPDDPKLSTIRTSTRRRAPPKRMIEDDESLLLNLSAASTSGNKRFKLTPKQEPIDEAEQSQVVVIAKGLTAEEDDPNVKPRHSYCTLIILAMLSAPNYTMTLDDMYRYITGRFAYYRNSTSSWKNGIRHNLSMNKLFRKMPRIGDQPGKGSFWTFAKHVNPDVQFSQHLQQQSVQQPPTQQSNRMSSPVDYHEIGDNELGGDLGRVRSNNQSPSHPLRTLVLEQLQNAANGAYSNVNPLFGTTSESSVSATSNKTLPKTTEKKNVEKEQALFCGLPSMSHEQLAMAQANWYIAQLATQRGFALVPEFYERCLKQIQAYYSQEPTSSNLPTNKFGLTVKQELKFDDSIEHMETARKEDGEETID